MLTELCQYLKNWFEYDQLAGKVTITGDNITVASDSSIFGFNAVNTPTIIPGQYIRIIGSVFNDGVVQYGTDELIPETFDGAVWLMAVPKEIITLCDDITEWRQKYETVTSHALSPFDSESFKGYSYSKSSSSSSSGSGAGGFSGWQGAFYSRLAQWRKI